MPKVKENDTLSRIRGEIKKVLVKKFGDESGVNFEKRIFESAQRIAGPAIDAEELIVTYRSIAYDRVAELFAAPDRDARALITSDMKHDRTVWESSSFTKYASSYKASLFRSIAKPKAVKGLHICKSKKCKGEWDEFYIFSMQTRGGDEGMTHYRQCSKCEKRNKE